MASTPEGNVTKSVNIVLALGKWLLSPHSGTRGFSYSHQHAYHPKLVHHISSVGYFQNNLCLLAAFCPSVTIESDKGRYVWPRAGYDSRSELPCQLREPGKKAFYSCSNDGKRTDLDLKACKYTRPITQLLYELSTVSLLRM